MEFEETSFTMRTFGTTSNLVPIEIMTFIIENIQSQRDTYARFQQLIRSISIPSQTSIPGGFPLYIPIVSETPNIGGGFGETNPTATLFGPAASPAPSFGQASTSASFVGASTHKTNRTICKTMASTTIRTPLFDKPSIGQTGPTNAAPTQPALERIKRGLVNLGNTCFMNSSLQFLVHISDLSKYFWTDFFKQEINNTLGHQGAVAISYANVVKELLFGSNHTFAPIQLKEIIGRINNHFAGYGEQDSYEFLLTLLGGLHEDFNKIPIIKKYQEVPDIGEMTEVEFATLCWEVFSESNNSIIFDLFYGQLKSRSVCQVCQKVSIKFDPYMGLQLPIPEPQPTEHANNETYTPEVQYAEESFVTLEDCMNEFTKKELLTGANSMYCSNCKTNQETEKSLSVYMLPPVNRC